MTPSSTSIDLPRPSYAIRAVLLSAFIAIVAFAGMACGGGDDASSASEDDDDEKKATSTPATSKVPSGWEKFDFGALSGAAPGGWEASMLNSEEFLELARAGLSKLESGARFGRVSR